MAAAKEIRVKIGSIRNTQKITKAMEMVAASKMRKTQERMRAARPYAEKIRNVIAHLEHAKSEYRSPFLERREDMRHIGLIVVSTDRGLCGGLNANLFRKVVRRMQEWDERGIAADLCAIGSKGVGFFSLIGAPILSRAARLGDEPSMEQLIGTIKIMLDAYEQAKIDRLYIVYNRFVNSMTQSPEIEQLLPLPPSEAEEMKFHWDYIYEPDAREVLDHLIRRYLESLIYQCVVENIACEQAARMVAMKSAADNAGKLIDELQLIYNKARQAAITQELSEIVGGAAAVA